jgi:hypothetical protein
MTKFDPIPAVPFAPPETGIAQGLARGARGFNRHDPAESIWSNLFDVDDSLLAIPRGVEGFFHSVYNLSDWALGDALPDWDDQRLLGRSDTLLGGTVEGMTQFLTGFLPGVGLLGKAGKLARTGRLGATGKAAAHAARKSPIAARIGRDVVAGAGGDFLAFDAHEARLSNFLKDQFGLDNEITNYLAANEQDTEIEGRIKNLLEGGGLGLAVDSFLQVLRGVYKMSKAKAGGASPDDLAKIQEEAIGDGADLELAVAKVQEEQAAKGVEETPPDLRADEDVDATRLSEEEVSLEELTKSAKKADGVYSVTIEGEDFSFYRDPESRVYKRAGTDEVLTLRDGSRADAVAELRKRRRGQQADETLSTVEVKKPHKGVEPEDVSVAIGALRRVQQIDDAGGQAVNPRTTDDQIGEVMRTHMNLENVAPDDKGWTNYVRAVEQLYDDAIPPDVDARTMVEMDAKSEGDIRDLLRLSTDSELPEGVYRDAELRKAGEDDLKTARRLSNRKRAWTKTLKEQARRAQKAAVDALGAPEDVRVQKKLEFAVEMDRLQSAVRTVRGLSAISGRDLVMHKAGFVGAARLEILARRATLGGRNADQMDALMREAANAGEMSTVLDTAAKGHRAPTRFDALIEFWINSILGGGRTLSVNPLSNAGVALYRPMERMFGAAMTGNLPGMKDAILDYQSYVDNFMSAVRVGWDDGRVGQGRFLEGDKFSTGGQQRSLTPETFNVAEGSIQGRMINTMGKMRYATAILTGQDTFAKYLSFHANAQGILRRVKLEQQLAETGRMDPAAAAEWSGKQVQELVYRNQVLNEQVLFQKNLDEIKANETDAFPTEFQQMDEARDRASAQWNSEDSLLDRLVTEHGSRHALTDTYTNPINKDGRLLERGAAVLQNASASIPVLKFFVTFIRTPTQLLLWAQDRTLDPVLGFIRGFSNVDVRSALRKINEGDFGAGLELKARSAAEQQALAEGAIKRSDIKLPNIEKMQNKYLKQMLGDIDLPPGILPDSPEGRAAIKLAREDAVGRLSAGVGGMATLMTVAYANRDNPDGFQLTGRGPEDREQRQLLESTGWRPYSFHIPGVGYVEYRRFDPFATLLGTVADMVTIGQYSHNDDQGLIETLGASVVGAIANNATNKTYMTGLKNLLEIALDPAEKWGRFFPRFAASFVPVGPAELAKTLAGDDDPYMREVRSFTDAIMNKMIPYHGRKMDPQRNFLGEEVRKVRSLGHDTFGQIANITVPAAFSEVSDDFIMQEIAALKHGFMPPSTTRGGVELRLFKNSRGQSAYDRMLQLRKDVTIGGKTLRASLRSLIRSPRYLAMDPTSSLEDQSPRIDEISRIVGRYDRAASRQMMREFPDVTAESVRVRQETIRRRFSALEQVR